LLLAINYSGAVKNFLFPLTTMKRFGQKKERRYINPRTQQQFLSAPHESNSTSIFQHGDR
jgi:hypothetical protein